MAAPKLPLLQALVRDHLPAAAMHSSAELAVVSTPPIGWARFHDACRSWMLRCALGNLVDQLLVGAQSQADEIGVGRTGPGEHGAIVDVVVRREHLFDVGRLRNIALYGAAVDRAQRGEVANQHDDRLHRHGEEGLPGGVLIRLPDHRWVGGGDPAHQEGRHIETLPGWQVISDHDGNFGVEHSAIWT
jgi:hypothetical protein